MIVDSHCHLDFSAYENCRDDIVSRAKEAGVGMMVTINTRVRRFETTLAIAEKYQNVYCSIGTHPHYADEELDVKVEELVQKSNHSKVVAIGEAGLDFYRDNSPREAQEWGLRNQITAARETGLPLIIHSREADSKMLEILEDEMGKGVFSAVFHCFSSGRDLALRGIELGLYVSFSGMLTFQSNDSLRKIAEEMPSDRILVETDAPYLAPKPHRGKRNEPSFVVFTAQMLADTRGVSNSVIAQQTTDNFHRLFSKVPKLNEKATN